MGTQRKDTPMLPLWHMGTQTGDVWGHGGFPYGDTEVGDTLMSPLWRGGGDIWGHKGGDTLMLPLWQMGMWRGPIWGHPNATLMAHGDTDR